MTSTAHALARRPCEGEGALVVRAAASTAVSPSEMAGALVAFNHMSAGRGGSIHLRATAGGGPFVWQIKVSLTCYKDVFPNDVLRISDLVEKQL